MRILITGGAGFIGSTVTERLLERGSEVLVIDNYNTGRRDNLQPHPGLSIVEGSIADESLVSKAFKYLKPEIVIHAAASYKDPTNWQEDAKTNVFGTALIVKAAELVKVKRLIYFQTALCYGLHPKEQPITLNHPLQPFESSYAISKTTGENYIFLSKLDAISFRLANAYGPRNLSGPLPTFYHRISTGKPCFVMDTRRDFIFVSDLVNLVMKAVDGNGSRGAYHVATGHDYAIKELYDAAIRAMEIEDPGVEVKQRTVDDAYTILLDPSHTTEVFNWKPVTSLQTGVNQAIEWYSTHEMTETYTHLNLKKEMS